MTSQVMSFFHIRNLVCERTISAKEVTLGSYESASKGALNRSCRKIFDSRQGSHFGAITLKMASNTVPTIPREPYTVQHWLTMGFEDNRLVGVIGYVTKFLTSS